MPRLRRSLIDLKCSRGHDLVGDNRYANGRCRECHRLTRPPSGKPHNRDKTHCPKGHPYDGDNLLVYQRGERAIRVCRACKNERSKSRYWEVVKPVHHPGKRGRPRKTNFVLTGGAEMV